MIPNDFSDLNKEHLYNIDTPDKLYKFYSYAGCICFGTNNTYRVIRDKKLYFAHPKNYNDPFDCNPVIKTDYTDEEIERWFEDQGLSQHQIVEILNIKNLGDQLKKTFLQVMAQNIEKIRTCCFTNRWENPLLWAHYTNSHKGICLEFDPKKSSDTFKSLFKVEYLNNRLEYDHINNPDDLIKRWIKAKPECWAYEQEYRVWKQVGSKYIPIEDNLISFDPKALLAIYFGVNCPQSTIDEVSGLLTLENDLDHVQKWKVKLDPTTYSLIKTIF